MSGSRWIARLVPRGRAGFALTAAVAAAVALSACGAGPRQDASEPTGNFPVQVLQTSFPTAQSISGHTHMLIAVRNAGSKTIPNLAVTVCPVTCAYPAPPGEGTTSAVFDTNLGADSLDHPTNPPWIVDHPPGPCGPVGRNTNAGYSCRSGGAGAWATQYPNTWAAGPVAPGATKIFDWTVTAIRPGRHVVAWQVAAGLNGKAKAVLVDGGTPAGVFAVNVIDTPQKSYVNDAGQIVVTH